MARPKKERNDIFGNYKGYEIIYEEQRVVVAERGLYVSEFKTGNEAEEFIDGRTI